MILALAVHDLPYLICSSADFIRRWLEEAYIIGETTAQWIGLLISVQIGGLWGKMHY